MASAAAGAVIDFALAIGSVVAARVRIVLPPAHVVRTKHGLFPFNSLWVNDWRIFRFPELRRITARGAAWDGCGY